MNIPKVKLSEGQKIMQIAVANYLVSHYKLTPLERRLDLAKMRKIVESEEQRAMQDWPPIDDQYLDSPLHGQAAAINQRR